MGCKCFLQGFTSWFIKLVFNLPISFFMLKRLFVPGRRLFFFQLRLCHSLVRYLFMASGSILNFASLVKISRKENEGAMTQSLALLSFAPLVVFLRVPCVKSTFSSYL
jgi:hypothetical protein